jgi:hypothetical protein
MWYFATHYMWMFDAWTPQLVVIFLLGMSIGLLLAWSPRLVLLRAIRRINFLEEAAVTDRNKRASRARWDAKPEDDPLVQQLLAAKNKPVLDNEFPVGQQW